jgi:sialidase-1
MTGSPSFRASGCLLCLLAAMLSLTLGRTAAANVDIQKSDVFVAGRGGYFCYRIPGIVRTADGTLLAYAEARKDTGEDYDNIDLVLRRSRDGGVNWGPMETLVDSSSSTVNNAVMIVDNRQPGVVHFLYCRDYSRAFYRRSADHGQTFSPPMEITVTFSGFRPEFDWKLLATGPGHGIQLANGRLLVPIWLSPSKEQSPCAVGTIYSDDSGATWRRGDILVRSGDAPQHPMEGVVAQLSDGRVMMNIRNQTDRRAVSYSPDGARNWTKPKFDPNLKETYCFGSLLAVPQELAGISHALLFANPDNTGSQRKNLTAKMSLDDGSTWPGSLVIEPGFSGYSDLAAAADGTVFCLYERGAINKNYYLPQAISLARLKIQDLRRSPSRTAK